MSKYKCPVGWGDIPKEYKYKAMDSDGRWYAYLEQPSNNSIEWYSSNGEGYFRLYTTSNAFLEFADWENTLKERPYNTMSQVTIGEDAQPWALNTDGSISDEEDFEVNYSDRGCTCHLGHPPCRFCTHPGNPHNKVENKETEEQEDVLEITKKMLGG